mmetsp:Transcript_46582/g.108597  ORF Transcript_46582/g.108597 Transcript_46582/m.108597 type:complete len:291 (+) Transcript_46582:327-1199(+)
MERLESSLHERCVCLIMEMTASFNAVYTLGPDRKQARAGQHSCHSLRSVDGIQGLSMKLHKRGVYLRQEVALIYLLVRQMHCSFTTHWMICLEKLIAIRVVVCLQISSATPLWQVASHIAIVVLSHEWCDHLLPLGTALGGRRYCTHSHTVGEVTSLQSEIISPPSIIVMHIEFHHVPRGRSVQWLWKACAECTLAVSDELQHRPLWNVQHNCLGRDIHLTFPNCQNDTLVKRRQARHLGLEVYQCTFCSRPCQERLRQCKVSSIIAILVHNLSHFIVPLCWVWIITCNR